MTPELFLRPRPDWSQPLGNIGGSLVPDGAKRVIPKPHIWYWDNTTRRKHKRPVKVSLCVWPLGKHYCCFVTEHHNYVWDASKDYWTEPWSLSADLGDIVRGRYWDREFKTAQAAEEAVRRYVLPQFPARLFTLRFGLGFGGRDKVSWLKLL